MKNENYIIDFNKKVNIKTIKPLFKENGFLHLKNILDTKILQNIKVSIVEEFKDLKYNNNLSKIDKKVLDRGEMPVIHRNCPRINTNIYQAHTNEKLSSIIKEICEDDYLWHFPAQIRRINAQNKKEILPYHQDCHYNNLYANMLVCWTPLSDCGKQSPSLEIIRTTIDEKKEHKSNKIWEFGISQDLGNSYISKYGKISLENISIGDLVIFDAYTLHRTYKNEDMNNTRYSMDLRAISKNFLSKELLDKRKYIMSSKAVFTKENE